MPVAARLGLYLIWLACLLLMLVLIRNDFVWMLGEDPGAVLPEDPRESFKGGLAGAALALALGSQLWLGFRAASWRGRAMVLALAGLVAAAWVQFYFGG